MESLSKRIDVLEQQIALLSNSQTKTSLKTKVDKPKKKPSGYNLYCKEMQEEAKNKLTNESNTPIKQTDIMKQLGLMWKLLSDEQKKEWNIKLH